MQFRYDKFAVSWKIWKKLFYRKKIQLQVFKIGGFGDKKMFRKSFETSLIISLKKDNLPYLAVLCKTFSIGKYSNFKFQKSGNFGSNSLWVIGQNRGFLRKKNRNPNWQQAFFLKSRAKRSAPISCEAAQRRSRVSMEAECQSRVDLTTMPLPSLRARSEL